MKRVLIIIVVLIIAGFALYNPILSAIGQFSKPKAADAKEVIITETQQIIQTNDSTNLFIPTEFTPQTYVPPKYDPFTNKNNPDYNYQELIDPSIKHQPDIPPVADFTIQPKTVGLADNFSGTVGTEFLFNAGGSSDQETAFERLMARWDFEGEGVPDTYFSLTKSGRHIYTRAGSYNVVLEVLDTAGNVTKAIKAVKIVENTNPVAFFTYAPDHGTDNTVIKFNTEKSFDSQYLRQYLQYRFDWDSDGVWDTKYDPKTLWNHKFGQIGVNHVTMEAKDPEGLTDQTFADVSISENTAPKAEFTFEIKKNGAVNSYFFDGSASSDAETPFNKLQFRWDFNYTGENDIAFDTSFNTSSKTSGFYNIPGNKTVRLQVRDEDGAVSEAFVSLDVE